MLGTNEEAYFFPSLSAEGGEACLKRFEGGTRGGTFSKVPPRECLLKFCRMDSDLIKIIR